ncbi:MAG: MerR family transcriptional regulator [Ilumatobacteraceae bacterium]
MADAHEQDFLSIGEVLGLLLEEFPDVTISKIRFLESQGLISPERTPSGYRKFYDSDVDLLRVILTEQRRNYLPLRVIKDRLETGEIDPTGEHLWGDGERTDLTADPQDATPADVPSSAIAIHPASRGTSPDRPGPTRPEHDEPARARLLPNVVLDRAEFCQLVGLSDDELDRLEEFGIVRTGSNGREHTYDHDAVAVARPAVEFLRRGIDARHLRFLRNAAEREASLFEQVVQPKFRQRNPEARAEAVDQLRQLDRVGSELRTALVQQALRRHLGG